MFPDLTVSENIFMGQTGRRRSCAGGDMHAAGGGDPAPAGGRRRSAHRRLAADRRRPAGGRDRQGDVPRRARADHGRADGGAVGARGPAGCSARCAGWPRRAWRSCSSATGSTRCSSSATGSPCSATASTSRRKPVAEVTEVSLIRDMVGRELSDFFRRVAHEPGDVALSVEALGRAGAFEDISSRSAPARCSGSPASSAPAGPRSPRRCSASGRPTPGSSAATDEVVEIRSPREAMARGIAYVSEDRRRLGLSLPQSVTANITLPGLRRFVARWRLVDRTRRAAGRRRLPAAAADPQPVAGDAGRQPLRRQPAEGDARQVARHQAGGADLRRADPRHRRRRQGRRPRADRRARPRRRRGDPHLVRPPRGAGDERPRAGHARRPADGDLRRDRPRAGADHDGRGRDRNDRRARARRVASGRADRGDRSSSRSG